MLKNIFNSPVAIWYVFYNSEILRKGNVRTSYNHPFEKLEYFRALFGDNKLLKNVEKYFQQLCSNLVCFLRH